MNIQEQALKEFNSVGYPTVKSESWRFTDISRLKNYSFDGLWKESNISYEPFDNIYMIFENGKLSLEKSNLDSLPDGLTLKSINDFKELKIDSLKSEKNGIINLNTAKKIIINAKMRRTSICGAVETLLIEEKALKTHAIQIINSLRESGCEVRVDNKVNKLNSE